MERKGWKDKKEKGTCKYKAVVLRISAIAGRKNEKKHQNNAILTIFAFPFPLSFPSFDFSPSLLFLIPIPLHIHHIPLPFSFLLSDVSFHSSSHFLPSPILPSPLSHLPFISPRRDGIDISMLLVCNGSAMLTVSSLPHNIV